MQPLELEPRDYGGKYKLVGGRLSLDFVNTLSYPDSDRPHDWLDPPHNAIDWALAVHIIAPAAAKDLEGHLRSDPSGAARSLARIHRHRAAIRRVVEPLARNEKPRPADVEVLNELLALGERFRTIDPIRLVWVWETPRRLDELTRPVIADAADLLVHADRARLGSCPACGWLFYDRTRNRTRRWCDMADCGSRDKSRRYYHRKLAAHQEEAPPG